jgi:GNAT superfamily N-acetyltransferase
MVHDEWLSALLQKPAFRLEGNVCAFSVHQRPKGDAFVGAKVSVEDVKGFLHLQSLGFRVMDTNLQFERPSAPLQDSTTNTRFALQKDSDAIRKLAREEFLHNRFHRDPEIDDTIALRIKEEWAANYFAGKRGKWMVVVEDHLGVGGFLQLLHDEENNVLIIDLIAVAGHYRGKGYARSMVTFASYECLGRPVPMKVGTQISNSASISLYTGLGFRLASATYLLHLHLKG